VIGQPVAAFIAVARRRYPHHVVGRAPVSDHQVPFTISVGEVTRRLMAEPRRSSGCNASRERIAFYLELRAAGSGDSVYGVRHDLVAVHAAVSARWRTFDRRVLRHPLIQRDNCLCACCTTRRRSRYSTGCTWPGRGYDPADGRRARPRHVEAEGREPAARPLLVGGA
jgi:hypothetical protein